MEYPSFIWQQGVSENETRRAVIPENVLTDLKITDMVRGDLKKYPLIPCESAEIVKRQGVFQSIEKNTASLGALVEIKNAVMEYKKIYMAYEVSESGTEKVLFFAVLVSSFINICERLAELDKTDGIFVQISGFFRDMLESAYITGLAGEIRACMLLRREGVRATVNGSSVTAVENAESMQNRFAGWFRHMGIEEELPTNKARRRLDTQCLEAYANIYRTYFHHAGEIYRKYRDSLMGEEYRMGDILYYNDEIAFIIDTNRYLDKFKKLGYPLCYPKPCEKRQIEAEGLIDAALVYRELTVDEIVPNDVRMYRERDGEKLNFYILSGANGGGKTTYLRAVGGAVLMFLLGLPITAKRAEIYPFRYLFTHFPSNETFKNSGRFADEEKRAGEIRERAGADTVALFNETYSGTDEKKSEDYSIRLATEMYEKGVFGLYVTHIHSLTNGEIPVLAAQIDETDENRRTYKIRRVSRTSSSYAYDILKKYHLDRESLENGR